MRKGGREVRKGGRESVCVCVYKFILYKFKCYKHTQTNTHTVLACIRTYVHTYVSEDVSRNIYFCAESNV